MEPRGVRNNNFGNIEDGPFARGLPGYTGTDGRFATFSTPNDGMEAINRLLMNYGRKGYSNINSIVGRWAPANDGNNVSAYASSVAQNTGYDPNAPLDMNDPAVRSAVARAIALHENGPGVASKLPGAGGAMPNSVGGMTPNARVQDGFMGLPMSPNERVADSFGAMDDSSVPPNATPTVGRAPMSLVPQAAAQPTKQPGADPSWVGTTGNALLNTGSILQSLGSIDGKSIIPQLAQNAMALQQTNKPQWGVISEGLFGKKYGWINPNTQTVSGANGGGFGGAGSVPATGNAGLDDSLDKFEKLYADGERDPEKLKATLHPLLRGEVEGALEGKASASALGRGPARQVVMMLGHYLDPNFDETNYNQRNVVAKGFASTAPTSYGGIKLSAQTILNHAGEYLPLIDKIRSGTGLDDTGPDFARSFSQYMRSRSGNDPEFTYNLARAKQLSEGIAGETSRMQTGGPGSEATRSEYRTKLALDQPTGAIKGTLSSIVDLMDGKLQAAADQYNMAYGTQKTPRDFLEPKYKEIYDRVKNASDEAAARGKASPSGAANDKRRPLSAF